MPIIKNKKHKNPVYISDVYKLKFEPEELDFFDANLSYDSPLFIDPFLLKRSNLKEEQNLFDRFADFFRFAYDESLNIGTDKQQYKNLLLLLNFKEPKEIGLGYTEYSNDGSSPGKNFAKLLIKFFLNDAARRLIKEDNLYPDKKFNPIALEIFTDRLGVDGLSDISANLIMDYLIRYTQKQCRLHDVPTKNLALNADGFDFDPNIFEWRHGGHYQLPENPVRPGSAIIFVPKRLLRSGEISDSRMVNKVIGILSLDANLLHRFTVLLKKGVEEFDIRDIRRIFEEENSIFKKFMLSLEQDEHDSYDLAEDPESFFAFKKYKDIFANIIAWKKISKCEDIFNITKEFVEIVKQQLSKTDGWKDMWKNVGGGKKMPASEAVAQRIIRAMGQAFFAHYPDITFEPEVGTGNGPVDFKIIYLNCRIVIEVKRLLSSSYLKGVKSQLPEYSGLAQTNYSIYITLQHYTRGHPRPDKKHDDERVEGIELELPSIEAKIKKLSKNFKKLLYYNIDVSPKPSASNKTD